MFRIRSVVHPALRSLPLLLMACAMTVIANAATTLENLQAAFNGESNAHARYLAFAQQAENEGYGEVASLFRAAARAEEIHAANHAAVIREMGAVPEGHIQPLTVQSTRENLEAAIQGESYERDIMYPEFLQQARLDRNTHAVRTLNLARTAEIEHAKLFKAALSNLEQLKGTAGTIFYVCSFCGFTTREVNFSECPSCFRAKEGFEKVS